MESLKTPSIRSLLGWFNLAMVGAVSYSSAAVGMGVLQARLENNTPPPLPAVSARKAENRRTRLSPSAFQAILDANMFKARRSTVRSQTARPVSVTPTVAVQTNEPPPGLDLMLTGTMIMGKRSFALVAESSGQNEKVYRLLDCLPAGENHPTRECEPNQGTLVLVKKSRIEVDYRQTRFTIRLTDKSPPKGKSAPRRTGRRMKPIPGKSTAASKSRGAFPITRTGNVLEVRVPGAEVSEAFANFSDVLKQARVVPFNGPDGSGFQIRSIRPGSIFQRIGLHNFDVIKAVNGDPITTADQALRLLTMFRNEKNIVLDLKRRNEDLKLNYIIE